MGPLSRESIPYWRLYRFNQWYDIFRIPVNTGIPFRVYRYFIYIYIYIYVCVCVCVLYVISLKEAIYQGSQSCIGDYTNLTNGTIYFGTSQYWYIISGLLLFYTYVYIYIYICVCVCVCVCIIINIKVYHKTFPQFRTNYLWF